MNDAWRRWVDTEVFLVQLDRPKFVDVRVTIDPGDGSPPLDRSFEGLSVVGALDLDLDY